MPFGVNAMMGAMSPVLAVAWWDWPIELITRHIRTIMSGSIDALEAAAQEGTS